MVIVDDFVWAVSECCLKLLVINGAILTLDLHVSRTEEVEEYAEVLIRNVISEIFIKVDVYIKQRASQ